MRSFVPSSEYPSPFISTFISTAISIFLDNIGSRRPPAFQYLSRRTLFDHFSEPKTMRSTRPVAPKLVPVWSISCHFQGEFSEVVFGILLSKRARPVGEEQICKRLWRQSFPPPKPHWFTLKFQAQILQLNSLMRGFRPWPLPQIEIFRPGQPNSRREILITNSLYAGTFIYLIPAYYAQNATPISSNFRVFVFLTVELLFYR